MLGFLAGRVCAPSNLVPQQEDASNLTLDGGPMLTRADPSLCKIVLLLACPKWYPSSHLWGLHCGEAPVAFAIFGFLRLMGKPFDIVAKIRYGS
jgi:hypothetical protein